MPWEGAADHAAWMSDARHLGVFIAVTRDGGEGRTTTTRSGRVRLDYRLDATGVATLRHAVASCARLARASDAPWTSSSRARARRCSAAGGASDGAFERFIDAPRAFDFRPNPGTVLSAHQMGTARMGGDPRTTSATRPGASGCGADDDRVVGGLYVADTSLFPTGLGVNPMLTVMALARRVARTVLAEG